MGRFDALTQLEEDKPTSTPSPEDSTPAPKKNPTQQPTEHLNVEKKPEIMKSRIHESLTPPIALKEKPLKYSTLLDSALIKKIKLLAAEREMKDYEVIEIALTEYFEKHSKS